MFSWAASTFESIVQTVAPPPTDSKYKFVFCCQQGDEDGAILCLQDPLAPSFDGTTEPIIIDPTRTILVQVKGHVAIHLACLHTLPKLLDYILQRNDIGAGIWQVKDIEGNTPLHCACLSQSPNTLDFVKKILMYRMDGQVLSQQSPPPLNTELVLSRNSRGDTPYDVAILNSVRQYLLPIQLQAETQAALDNGGIGLPPGVDLGGAKISYSNLAPPPPTAMPPTNGATNAGGNYLTTARYAPAPIPVIGGVTHTQTQQSPSDTPQQSSNYQQQYQPPFNPSYHTPTVASASVPSPPIPSQPPSVTNTNTSPQEAPRSGGYSLVGRSSAAIYKGSGGRVLPNDGFHSSSSDKNLQAKYGHAAVKAVNAIPPPPSSGNVIPIHAQSAPSSLNGVGPNPFAAGGALGNRRAVSGSRYVSYDPIRGTSTLPLPPPPPPAARAFNPGATAQPFSTFTPGVPNNSSNDAPATSVISPAFTTQIPSNGSSSIFIPPLPPPPSIGARTASYNTQNGVGPAITMTSPDRQMLVQPTPANTPIDPTPINTLQSPMNNTPASALFSAPNPGLFSKPPSGLNNQNPVNTFSSPFQGASTPSKSPGVPLPSSSPFTPGENTSSPFDRPSPFASQTVYPTSAVDSAPSPYRVSTVAASPSGNADPVSIFSSPSKGDASGQSLETNNSGPVTVSEPNDPTNTSQEKVDSVMTEVVHDDEDEGMMDEIPLTPWTENSKQKLDGLAVSNEQQPTASTVFASPATTENPVTSFPPPPPPFSQRF